MAQPARTGLLRSIRHHTKEAAFVAIAQTTASNSHRGVFGSGGQERGLQAASRHDRPRCCQIQML